MVGRRGAPGQQQFGHRHGHGRLQGVRSEPSPHRIQTLQPGEQFGIRHRRPSARERLVEVVMRVDQAGQHHVGGGVENPVVPCRLRSRAHHLRDDPGAGVHHQAAARFSILAGGRVDTGRIFDPEQRAVRLRGRVLGGTFEGHGAPFRATAVTRDELGMAPSRLSVPVCRSRCRRFAEANAARASAEGATVPVRFHIPEIIINTPEIKSVARHSLTALRSTAQPPRRVLSGLSTGHESSTT